MPLNSGGALRVFTTTLVVLLAITAFAGDLAGNEVSRLESVDVAIAQQGEDGVFVHSMRSTYQANRTEVRVLLPSPLMEGKRYPVIYILPVEAGRESRFGDGLSEVLKHKLQTQYEVIFVAPTFSHLPWYADHPTDREVRQESYLLQAVIPFVERTYPVSTRGSDRLLLGFSKSGWGAWSLLLRHPEQFGRAVAWDAPLMMQEPGQYGNGPIFQTPDNFANYCLTDKLRERAETLQKSSRLILTGYGNFQKHHLQMHAFLDSLKVPHTYRDGPQLNHDWHSGWVPEGVELLVSPGK